MARSLKFRKKHPSEPGLNCQLTRVGNGPLCIGVSDTLKLRLYWKGPRPDVDTVRLTIFIYPESGVDFSRRGASLDFKFDGSSVEREFKFTPLKAGQYLVRINVVGPAAWGMTLEARLDVKPT